jgi:hypothetical protein
MDEPESLRAHPVNTAFFPLISTVVSITIGPTPFRLSWKSAQASVARSKNRQTTVIELKLLIIRKYKSTLTSNGDGSVVFAGAWRLLPFKASR